MEPHNTKELKIFWNWATEWKYYLCKSCLKFIFSTTGIFVLTTLTWPRCNELPRGKSVLLEVRIIGPSFYQTSKRNVNFSNSRLVSSTKAVKFCQRRLCFSNQSTNASCICLYKKISRFSNTNCISTKISGDLLK